MIHIIQNTIFSIHFFIVSGLSDVIIWYHQMIHNIIPANTIIGTKILDIRLNMKFFTVSHHHMSELGSAPSKCFLILLRYWVIELSE